MTAASYARYRSAKGEATISSVNVGRLVDLIRVVAHRQPDAPAIEFEGGTQAYRETYEAALRLANGLRQSGLQPGDAVGTLTGSADDHGAGLIPHAPSMTRR